jgi:hypothetical protein
VTQAIGQYLHHMRRKVRCLLNEKVKLTAVGSMPNRRGERLKLQPLAAGFH